MESTGWSTNVLNILIDQAVLYFSHRVPYCIAIVVFVLCYFHTMYMCHNDDLIFQETVVVDKENPAFKLLWEGCSTAAHSSVRRVSPAVLWETLHSAFLCVDVGHSTLVALWWPLMLSSSCQQLFVLLPP